MNANGGTGYAKDTMELCQTQCRSMPDCVAFDFDPNGSSRKCWIHTDKMKANQLTNAPGVTHFAKNCDSTSKRTLNCMFQIID